VHENHHLVARVDKALGLETPLGPCVPKHRAQSNLSLPAAEDRLALRVAAWELELVLLVEKVAKRPIEEGGILVGACVSQIRKQRVLATDKLNVLRHGPPRSRVRCRCPVTPAPMARQASHHCGAAR
jgi:hypothetical protein